MDSRNASLERGRVGRVDFCSGGPSAATDEGSVGNWWEACRSHPPQVRVASADSGPVEREKGFEPWQAAFLKSAMLLVFRRQGSRFNRVSTGPGLLASSAQSPRIDPIRGDEIGDGALRPWRPVVRQLALRGIMKSMQPARSLPHHIDDNGPRPVVAGTDIKVSQIAWEHEHYGMTPDEIVEAHPHLTLADVHAALAYFYDHADDIRLDWRETDRVIEEMKAKLPPGVRPRPSAAQ